MVLPPSTKSFEVDPDSVPRGWSQICSMWTPDTPNVQTFGKVPALIVTGDVPAMLAITLWWVDLRLASRLIGSSADTPYPNHEIVPFRRYGYSSPRAFGRCKFDLRDQAALSTSGKFALWISHGRDDGSDPALEILSVPFAGEEEASCSTVLDESRCRRLLIPMVPLQNVSNIKLSDEWGVLAVSARSDDEPGQRVFYFDF